MILLILAISVTELPTCTAMFQKIERKLEGWSKARRYIDGNGEEHTYHRVTPEGVTVQLRFVETDSIGSYELSGYEAAEKCLRDGKEKTIMYRMKTK